MSGGFHHTPDPDEATLTDRHEPYTPTPRRGPFIRRFHPQTCVHAADEKCPGCPHPADHYTRQGAA